MNVKNVPLAKIALPPEPLRAHIDIEALEELSRSIQEVGLLEPIILARNGERFTIIAGHRRFLAVRNLAWPTIPAIIRSDLNLDQAYLSLTENLQRQDLNPIDEARALEKLIAITGATQEEVARTLGKNRTYVTKRLGLLQATPLVQMLVSKGELPPSHAYELTRLEDAERQDYLGTYASRMGASFLTVKGWVTAEQNRQRAQEPAPPADQPPPPPPPPPIPMAQCHACEQRFPDYTLTMALFCAKCWTELHQA